MGFEGCGASERAQWAWVQVTLALVRSLAGFNGAYHGFTAGSSSGKSQLKFWLGVSKKKSRNKYLSPVTFINHTTLQGHHTDIQNGK